MNVKTKLILLAAITAIVQVIIAALMILLWNWMFDGWVKTVLMIVTVLVATKFVIGQIPWAITKVNESQDALKRT